MRRLGLVISLALGAAGLSSAQPYTGTNVTGQFVLTQSVNLMTLSQGQAAATLQFNSAQGLLRSSDRRQPWDIDAADLSAEIPFLRRRSSPGAVLSLSSVVSAVSAPTLSVTYAPDGAGFLGLTHLDQRQSYGGNQFSIEPPSPSLAVGNGYILEGVNNAVQVFTTSGTPLLPQVLSTNQVFGLAPSINRTTNLYGPFPTDMRVFFDADIQRWFIVQRAQDNDIFRNPLDKSHLYVAVSQTADPTGTYNIYVMDTTNASNSGCPCYFDFPQLGADKYGFYISGTEYNTSSNYAVDARILAISKSSLAAGATLPTVMQFLLRRTLGYEYAIQPAVTPPGASYFVANNGLEYFVSSVVAGGSNLAVWAMANTGSLATANPSLTLSFASVPTLTYLTPPVAVQRSGPLPYGSSLSPAGRLAYIDGADCRILSLTYAGGRLYATLATRVSDTSGNPLVGGAYFVLTPTYRNGVVSALPLRQGYLVVNGNDVLAPSIAVNAQGRGAVAFTLAGPDYYPSAAFVPIETMSTGTELKIAGVGVQPEDGFSGYPGGLGVGTARWGDYSTAVTAADGSIWMVAEYIPNAPRTQLANWGTYLMHYIF